MDAGASGENAAVILSRIAALEEEYQEEWDHLKNLEWDAPLNEAHLKLQETVLFTVQKNLNAEKQKLASLEPEKPAKGKGGGGPERTGGAAIPAIATTPARK